ncbi:MAG: BMP family ABC transporter substrate-binding protein [Gemmatimonadales bacterium]|nr:BMP family ABC transporter substrate-binding protein [Gemmatimonadales bacterium]
MQIVGIIGGLEIPPVRKYVTGFAYGILNTCPNCSVVVRYVGSFSDQARGLAIGLDMVQQGADVLFRILKLLFCMHEHFTYARCSCVLSNMQYYHSFLLRRVS